MADKVSVTDTEGNVVEVDPEFIFGEEGDEKPIPLVITGEVFYAVAEVPAEQYGQLTTLLAELPKGKQGQEPSPEDADRMMHAVMSMLDLFLLEESADRLRGRLSSRERPVGIVKLMDLITKFLTKQYGAGDGDERPTKPTSA